jgi:hypothetical protein
LRRRHRLRGVDLQLIHAWVVPGSPCPRFTPDLHLTFPWFATPPPLARPPSPPPAPAPRRSRRRAGPSSSSPAAPSSPPPSGCSARPGPPEPAGAAAAAAVRHRRRRRLEGRRGRRLGTSGRGGSRRLPDLHLLYTWFTPALHPVRTAGGYAGKQPMPRIPGGYAPAVTQHTLIYARFTPIF